MTDKGRQYGGRYQVTGSIASGGMAEVYHAQDQLLGRSVALKVLHPEYARDRVFIERFRREAQAAASLNDPRIVSVFDWGSDDGTYYLVMEYVEGKTLREMIKSEGPLSAERAAKLAADVCSALEIAHQHGIVHRDVKPANIVVTQSGQTKVMDFGIARAAADSGQTMTQTGTVMGTANYLSPEQAQGLAVDARSDVYSAGVVLYEMLTNEVPFKADTAVAIAYKHVKEDPAPPSDLNHEIPAALDAIVMKALAKNPDNRYQTAREMRQDLERVLRGESVQATPLLPPDQTIAVDMRGGATQVLPVQTTQETSRRRKTLAYLLVITMFLGVLVALVSLLISFLGQSAPQVVVPDVVGLSFEDAERRLDAEGLNAVLDRREYSETIQQDFVISQDPDDGLKVAQGARVLLVVSRGPERIDVPDLRGKTLEVAQQLLEEADLKLGATTTVSSDEVEDGLIVSQDPTSGTRVQRGSSVDVEVSSGKQTVLVPNVTGVDVERAKQLLTDRGLNPVVKTGVCNTGERNNVVLDQDPAPREEVREGSDVTITVNEAPRVPDVRGQTEGEARKELEEAGFVVRVKYDGPTPITDAEGRVTKQDPQPGKAQCKGDTVEITVTRA